MRKTFTLVIILLSACLFSLYSCTYDYFEDETNYLLYVPEVKEGAVSDCQILVYNSLGNMVATKSFLKSNNNNPKYELGLFGFRLPPGDYKVYCFTNTDKASLVRVNTLKESSLILNRNEKNKDYYAEPSDILFQELTPQIETPNLLKTDTAKLDHYTGRVTIRFKKIPVDVSQIDSVQLIAANVATIQSLSEGITAAATDDDKIYDKSPALTQTNPEYFELDYRFLPTVKDLNMYFDISFFDSNSNLLGEFPINVVDKEGVPIQLLAGQRVIIEIDTYMIFRISVVGWEEDILSSDTNME